MFATLFGIVISLNPPQHQVPDGIYDLVMYDTLGYSHSQAVYIGCIGVIPSQYCMMDQDTGVMFHLEMYSNKLKIWHQFEHDFMCFDGDIKAKGYVEGTYDSWHNRGYFTMEFKHGR